LQNHWSGLTVFLDHPDVPLDNNADERAERGAATLGGGLLRGTAATWSLAWGGGVLLAALGGGALVAATLAGTVNTSSRIA
jgi:hypothetical protein